MRKHTISHLVRGDGQTWILRRTYWGYTKREAQVMFNTEIRENGWRKI